MRTVGIIAVCIGHFLQYIGKRNQLADVVGYLCMNLFFVLSGFLIGSLIFNELKNTHRLKIINFYLRRNLKLLPSYYLVLALYFVFPITQEDPEGIIPSFWRFATFTQNYFSSYGAFIQAWSLCVEEQFYLIFPWLGLYLFKFKNKTCVRVFLILISICTITRFLIWMHIIGTSTNVINDVSSLIYFPTWSRIDALSIGCLLAYVRFFYYDVWSILISKSNKNLLGFILFLILSFILQINFYTWYGATFTFLISSIAFSFFILYAFEARSFVNRSNNLIILLIAKLAYSLYLTHRMSFKITDIVIQFFNIKLSMPFYVLFTFSFVMLNACFLYYLVEFSMSKLAKNILKNK